MGAYLANHELGSGRPEAPRTASARAYAHTWRTEWSACFLHTLNLAIRRATVLDSPAQGTASNKACAHVVEDEARKRPRRVQPTELRNNVHAAHEVTRYPPYRLLAMERDGDEHGGAV
jgi:hypothetical protein